MAAHRRALPRGPESAGPGPGRGGRRHSSARKGRSQQDPWGRWLKAAIFLLLSAAAGGGLVVWSRVRTQDGIPGGGIPAEGVTEGEIPADGVTEVLAHRSDNLRDKFIEIPCSEDYDSHKRFAGCTPRKCGRGVTDAVITREEAERIRRIAERGLALGGSDGGFCGCIICPFPWITLPVGTPGVAPGTVTCLCFPRLLGPAWDFSTLPRRWIRRARWNAQSLDLEIHRKLLSS